VGEGGMKSVAPSAAHIAFREALIAAVRTQGATLDVSEVLAVLSHLVGQVIALQDQRTVTPEMAMELVSSNMERGNQEAVDSLLYAPGGHA
jgi:hypothetical protein